MEQDDTKLQFDQNGNLRHLLSLKDLGSSLLTELLDEAEAFLTVPGALPPTPIWTRATMSFA